MIGAAPLTLGTAGHVDHGKTALVKALTGVDTDRLEEEHRRGISIALGYARLELPSGRAMSLVDVPGHERFVRTMVAGASGVDCFLMVVAADDGVMPQTVEHAAVLRGLGIERGVVAVTKVDLADPNRAIDGARELVPGCEIVSCSTRTGAGVAEVAAALERVAEQVPSRADPSGAPVLHVDRSFTVDGPGTVVTGTLWSGALRVGDRLELLPEERPVRVRGLEVHGRPSAIVAAGQRVAVNLAGVRARDVVRGAVLARPSARQGRKLLDCELVLSDYRKGERVQVHHGTREAPGRLVALADDLFQLRLETPLLAADGERLVVRRIAPAGTLGGGTILDVAARRHGARPEILARLRRRRDAGRAGRVATTEVVPNEGAARAGPSDRRSLADAETLGAVPSTAPPLPAGGDELEARLRQAGLALLDEAAIDDRAALRSLVDAGRAVRVSGRSYGHRDVVAVAVETVARRIGIDGSISLAEARDALAVSRRSAQALLEHLDARQITIRRSDDRRIVRRGAWERLRA